MYPNKRKHLKCAYVRIWELICEQMVCELTRAHTHALMHTDTHKHDTGYTLVHG